jgi:zinc protease
MSDKVYPGPETIHRRQLSNGITVLIYENFASDSIVLEGVLRAGALVESPEKAGLADFTADLLMRGTQARTFEEIYETLESIGASLSFGSGRHTTHFSGRSLVEDADLLLELLGQSLRQPTFPEPQVELVRGQTMTGLQMRANDTRQMARLTFFELLYAGHPYGRSASGYLDTIPTITRKELIDFHRDYYGPQGMIITLVGAMKHEDALAKIETVLGDWQPTQQKPMPEAPDAPRPSELVRQQVTLPGKTQADLILGLPGPRRSAPDYLDASLMNTILGVFGMMGRIGKSVREEQGLAYYAYSQLSGGTGPTPWIASAGVAPDKVEQAISSIREEIRRIQTEPVTGEELADSQAYRTGSLPVSLETNAGLADIITDMELFDLGLDYLQRYPEMIRSITAERIQSAAQKYLSADEIAIAVAGP